MIWGMTEPRKAQSANKYILRFAQGMRERIVTSAKENGRTINAEINHRLETAFDNGCTGLPAAVHQAVQQELTRAGGTVDEALTRLVLAGQAQGGTLLYVTVAPGTQVQQFKDLLKAGEKVIPPNSMMVLANSDQ
jgi:hypothetical protein